MEEKIKAVLRNLKIQYVVFWLVPLLLVAAYETGFVLPGAYAGDGRMQYILETAGILLAIALVPLALKLFSMVLRKKIDRMTFPVALSRYSLWSGIRLLLLEVVVLLNVVVYYFTLDNIGMLCALIGLTASIFCLPGIKRLREELNIEKEERDI